MGANHFKVETGQVTLRKQHVLRMTALAAEQQEILAKLKRHERAMRHIKRTNYKLWLKLRKEYQ